MRKWWKEWDKWVNKLKWDNEGITKGTNELTKERVDNKGVSKIMMQWIRSCRERDNESVTEEVSELMKEGVRQWKSEWVSGWNTKSSSSFCHFLQSVSYHPLPFWCVSSLRILPSSSCPLSLIALETQLESRMWLHSEREFSLNANRAPIKVSAMTFSPVFAHSVSTRMEGGKKAMREWVNKILIKVIKPVYAGKGWHFVHFCFLIWRGCDITY